MRLSGNKPRITKFTLLNLVPWLKNYLGKNYQIFDLGGTGRGSGLEIFKQGWGVKKYPIFEIKNFSEVGLKKSKLRDAFTILPSFLLEKISPYFLKFKL